MERRRIEPLILGAEDGIQQHPCRLRMTAPERLVAVLGIESTHEVRTPQPLASNGRRSGGAEPCPQFGIAQDLRRVR